VVEQGLHCRFGFYEQMAALLGRAGVDIKSTSTSGNGEALVWEERDGRTHRLWALRSGAAGAFPGAELRAAPR
jgi:hypothetical protein